MRVLLRAALLLPLLLPSQARADIEPGNWEITATTQMEGMPQPIGPISRTECLTADAASDPGKVLSPGSGSCAFSNRRQSGDTYSFDVNCGGAFPMRGTGSVRYGGQSLDGRLDLGAELQGKRVGMSSRISGRRLGACAR
jgi:hypothetical protein